MSNAVAIINQDEIIQQLSNGSSLKAIAVSMGITTSAISQNLSNHPEYQQALTLYAEHKLDEAEGMLLNAQDSLNLTRGREYLNHTRWLAERLARDKYGKDTVQVSAQAPVFNVILNTAPVSGVEIEVKSE